jgi:hypothetical protein
MLAATDSDKYCEAAGVGLKVSSTKSNGTGGNRQRAALAAQPQK